MTFTNQELQILLVEDNRADAELTLDALRDTHMVNKIQWVQDGAAALETLFEGGVEAAAETRRLRLVLLDLKLPRVDGLEVLRRLRADIRTRHLPVVVLTSSREEVDLVGAYEMGANSYMVKPVRCEAFMNTVRDVGLYWMLLNKLPGDPAKFQDEPR